ncbi:MAG: hypothetical protein M1830_008656 [Pleopsidium flavum]|nr:MAG: hypothetical protein M1830_008656 [Pleopsidium flavum]
MEGPRALDPQSSQQKHFLRLSSFQNHPPWENAQFDPRTGASDPDSFHRDSVDRDFVNDIYGFTGKPVFVYWQSLASAADSSEQIHRFSDSRHTVFEGKPLPDGSNLDGPVQRADGSIFYNGSIHLKSAFDYYKRWLTFLHYDELLTFTRRRRRSAFLVNDERIEDELHVDLRHECNLLVRSGNLKVPKLSRSFRPIDSLAWVPQWRDDIETGLAWMQAARNWATIYNEDVLHAVQQAFERIPLGTRVLAALLSKENQFERQLAWGHVEDENVNKRIWIVSNTSAVKIGSVATRELKAAYRGGVLEVIRHISQDLRTVYDYRLLRDWGYGRPWKKLWLIFDTDGNAELAQAIEFLRGVFSGSKRAYDLFDVHPVDKTHLSKDDMCAICQCEWEDDDLVMTTWCDHQFHAACLYECWDNEVKFDNACPLCRQSPGQLRDRVEIHAEKVDYMYRESSDSYMEETMLAAVLAPGARVNQMPWPYREAFAMHTRREEVRLATEAARARGQGVIP